MDTNLERFLWLVLGVVISILFQNFVNDPIKDWRARRSKRYGKRRLEELRLELTKIEEAATRQGEVTLSLLHELCTVLYLFFFILEVFAVSASLAFSGQIIASARGEPGLSFIDSLTGGIVSIGSFFLFDSFRRVMKRASNLANNIRHINVYKAKTEETIRDLEERR